jgi:hypothetical protein
MASVSGRRICVVRCRWPGVLVSWIWPRSASMLRLTTSMPTPRPDRSVTCVGGGEAGREDQLPDLGVGQGRVGGEQAALDGLGQDALAGAGRGRRR